MGGTVNDETWGAWSAKRLTSEAISVLVIPEVGARVVSLRDLRSGREWVLQAVPPSEEEARTWSSHAVVFGGRESFGWDECLPTVSVTADPTGASSLLRDHGDQWARPTETAMDPDGAAVTSMWASSEWPYRLSRRLSFSSEAELLAEYTLSSHGSERLPLLWSMHPTTALETGTRIRIPGTHAARATWTGGIGFGDSENVTWPLAELADGTIVDLSRPSGGAGWAAKLYAEPPGPVTVERADGSSLQFDWDQEFAPAVGIWLSCGGWPDPGSPVEQIAIEPTTSMDDDLGGALGASRARYLEPRGQLTWWVRLSLTP